MSSALLGAPSLLPKCNPKYLLTTVFSELYSSTVGGRFATRRRRQRRSYSLGYNKNGHSGGVHTSPEIFKRSRRFPRSSNGAERRQPRVATGFASCRAARGDCPWAFSAGRTSDRRRHPGRSSRHDRNRHLGRRRDRSDQAEGRRNHGADAGAVDGPPRCRAANHDHRLHDRETSRRPPSRVHLLRTGRMRIPEGGRTRGPLECERQRPLRSLRRAHAALGRSWQS